LRRSVQSPAAESTLPRFTRWLRPAVGAVARIRLSVHNKLLIGFLAGTLLLVGMAALSLVVIDRMNKRMVAFDVESEKVDLAQQLLYDITAQSHYRAMALLDRGHARDWNDKLDRRQDDFLQRLEQLRELDPDNGPFYDELSDANDAYSAASDVVGRAYKNGYFGLAEKWHLEKEHDASHVIEDMLSTCGRPKADPCGALGMPFIGHAQKGMVEAAADFHSDHWLLRKIVLAFSAASIATALLLGFLFSWAFVLPVKKVQHALAGLAAGRFGERVQVPNRDEFGKLSQDLNRASDRLAASFERQRSLAHSLRETNKSLARASEAKSRFLASVSHELRTPMNAILGFTDALLAGVDGPLNDEQRESLGWVQRGGRDLLGLINEILDLSRIEAGRLVLSPRRFDPRQLVADVVEQHRPLAAQKGLVIDFRDTGAPPEVQLDAQRVRQIVINILGNAVKFTDHGRVEVAVGSEGDGLHVSVSDTGAGIDPALREEIFEEFGQAAEDVAGTGLGLAISRRLARAMDGDVTVESEPGRGSAFHLQLPLAWRPSESATAVQEPKGTGGRGRLLLSIDDDPSVAPLLQKLLGEEDYAVVAASSPSTAVADARALRPAAILLDLLMEERAGEDILRELREDPATRAIPIVIISVVAPDEAPDLADRYLSKPLDRSALLATLADLELDGVRQ
jgi:signal transduction histidine kinase/CheY-like chemotaxis protein